MLQTLANLAQILGAVAVIAGIAFGFTQVRQFRQQRQDALAVELMKSIQDTKFTRSPRILMEVPDSTSAARRQQLAVRRNSYWPMHKCDVYHWFFIT